MHVQDESGPHPPRKDRSEDQKVRQGVDVDDGIASLQHQARQTKERPREKCHVLEDVTREDSPFLVQRNRVYIHSVQSIGVLGRGGAQSQNVDRVSRCDQCLGLPPDSYINVVVIVEQNAD